MQVRQWETPYGGGLGRSSDLGQVLYTTTTTTHLPLHLASHRVTHSQYNKTCPDSLPPLSPCHSRLEHRSPSPSSGVCPVRQLPPSTYRRHLLVPRPPRRQPELEPPLLSPVSPDPKGTTALPGSFRITSHFPSQVSPSYKDGPASWPWRFLALGIATSILRMAFDVLKASFAPHLSAW